MQYTTIFAYLSLTVAPLVLAESCLNGGGVCTSPSNCLNNIEGSVSVDLCSGGDNNRCCDTKGDYSCGPKGKGRCKYTDQKCSGGSFQTGYCPFGNDFRCCVPN